MKLLLTSNGITNQSIHRALVDLLGKPIAEANALFVATGMYPYPGGLGYAWKAIAGKSHHPFAEMGWKSFGNLELSVLSSVDRDIWLPALRETDAILVWGGDPLFITHWLRVSGVAEIIPTLNAIYVGTSAGSMLTASTFVETYTNPRRCAGEPLSAEPIVFPGNIERTLVKARGMGWVDFAIIPHLNGEHHPDATPANTAQWASHGELPTYALDDNSAIVVSDGRVEVVSEGNWKRFEASKLHP